MTADAHQHDAYERAAETLDWIASPRDNWDAEGAPGFSPALVAKARNLIDKLPWIPFIAPIGRETIQANNSVLQRRELVRP